MTDFNLSHALMLAKLRVEPGLQRLSIPVSALGQRYERFGHFTKKAVGYANHPPFAAAWMLIYNSLALPPEYLQPANTTQLLQPVHDAHITIPIPPTHTHSPQPFTGEQPTTTI